MSPANGSPPTTNGKEDCEKLVDAVLPFAQQMLVEYGEFYPFGGYMKSGGEILSVGAKIESNDTPQSTDLLEVLRDSFSESARNGDCRATAIVFEVQVTPPQTDQKVGAIQVNVEHVAGYRAEVFYPYEIVANKIVLGTPFAQKGERRIFK